MDDVPVIVIECYKKNLNDSQMSNILDALLNYSSRVPNQARIGIEANFNQLTKVPVLIAELAQLFTHMYVYLSYNQITSISTDTFNYPNATLSVFKVTLDRNQITSVPTDAFKFLFATFIEIVLESNRIG